MFSVRVMHAFSHVNWTPAMHCILQSLAKCQITDWDKKREITAALHCLTVHYGIQDKVTLFVFKALNGIDLHTW